MNEQTRARRVLSDVQINSIAGATSGVFVSILVSPLDVTRTRIQVKRLPKGVRSTSLFVIVYRLFQQQGLRAFYKGLGATLIGYVPNWTIYFTVYQWSKKQYASQFSNHEENHELLINLLASVSAGAISNTVTAPVWTIRTRLMMQSNQEAYRNSFDAARKIYRNEGLYAFYRGLIPSMLGLIHVAIQFPVYEYLKKYFARHHSSADHHLSPTQLMLASSLSKLIASCVAYPHEVLRSRLQEAGHIQNLQPNNTKPISQYKNVRDALTRIFRDEGVRGFYRGLLPTLVRTVPAAVLTLSTYEIVKENLTVRFGVEQPIDDS